MAGLLCLERTHRRHRHARFPATGMRFFSMRFTSWLDRIPGRAPEALHARRIPTPGRRYVTSKSPDPLALNRPCLKSTGLRRKQPAWPPTPPALAIVQVLCIEGGTHVTVAQQKLTLVVRVDSGFGVSKLQQATACGQPEHHAARPATRVNATSNRRIRCSSAGGNVRGSHSFEHELCRLGRHA